MKRIICVAAFAASLTAQANVVPGLNGRLTQVDSLTFYGRRGAAYPNGEVGMAMLNEMCNPGTVTIPWQAAMQPNHPKFGFLIVRVVGDRIEQISDRSFVKHAFTSTNYSGACGTCQNPGTGTVMGINCADTYGAGNNADRTWLGPATEIDPWLGTWNPIGSYFDVGDPAQAGGLVLPPDGVRSLNIAGFDNVKNRVTVQEADFLTAGAAYFYGIHLIHQGEAVANRGDNLASRGFNPVYSGGTWSFGNNAVGQAYGSILQRWPGAVVNTGGNGNDDGRFCVASKVTLLGGGQFHYEYAVHNIDNNRGGATFRVPIDAGATASNFTFGDIDNNPLNDWAATRQGNEIVFTAPANNPLDWNTIYNFGFDANYAASNGVSNLDEARLGAGALTVPVGAMVPSGPPAAIVSNTGHGCGATVCTTSFYEFFANPAAFDLANSGWTMTYANNAYTVGAVQVPYTAPAGSTLTLSDDSEATVALPFSLPYPGGTTNQLVVCSNGFVSPVSNGTAYDPTISGHLTGAPRWAALWHDFNPGVGGQVRVESSASMVRITFVAVPNYSGGGSATFQYSFMPNGDVHVKYSTVTGAGNAYLVGYSPGGASPDPGNRDISATLGTPWSLCAASGAPVALNASARPIVGTTVNLTTTNIPNGTLLGLLILSTTQYNPGLDLTGLGMPGCELYLALDVLSTFPTPGGASVPYSVPNVPALAGVVLMAQSATLTPGINAFGFATSNGVVMVLGLN
jgi:hypothetical protein